MQKFRGNGTQAADVSNSSNGAAVSGNSSEVGAVSGKNSTDSEPRNDVVKQPVAATGTATGTGEANLTSSPSFDYSYVPAQAMLTCWYSLNRCVRVCMYVCVYVYMYTNIHLLPFPKLLTAR